MEKGKDSGWAHIVSSHFGRLLGDLSLAAEHLANGPKTVNISRLPCDYALNGAVN